MNQSKSAACSWMTVLISALVLFCAASPALGIKDVPRMSKEGLKTLLDNSDVIILDARTPNDWEQSGIKIKGAHRVDPSSVESWEPTYPKDKTIVVYCS